MTGAGGPSDGGRGGTRRTPALAVLLVLLGASLCGNVVLGRAALKYLRDDSAIRLDPAGLEVHAAERAAPAPDGSRLVLFGDSRAAMWEAPAPLPFRVVNRGIGYQTTAQILLRFDADVAPLHPSVVVLEAGVNDLKTIAQYPERRDEIVADCKANLRRIVERCRDAGATVVVVSVFDIGDVALWRRPFWSDDVATAVHEVNAFLAHLAGSGVVVFDANPVIEDERGHIRPEYQVDYLHLTEAAYAALNGKLVPLVSALPRLAPGEAPALSAHGPRMPPMDGSAAP